MNTLIKLLLNALEVEMGKFFIIPMTVDTIVFLFHPQLSGVGEGIILCRVAIGACETPVVGSVKFLPADHSFGAHDICNLGPGRTVEIGILGTAMASKAPFILIK